MWSRCTFTLLDVLFLSGDGGQFYALTVVANHGTVIPLPLYIFTLNTNWFIVSLIDHVIAFRGTDGAKTNSTPS